ncbi:MAG TPA: hypothetical protein VN442_17830 [Bryobacteraceae bacterium]|nr:hypothetical protein [Bryobacteraceae bacterium]
MYLRFWFVVGALMLCGCGRQERTEAVRFWKVLENQRADFTAFTEQETRFLDGAQSWCAGVMANGAGRGDQLDRNAETAGQLAKSADVLSGRLGRIRQAVYNEKLESDGTRSIRSTLIDQFAQRQRYLQEVRTMLQETAPAFLQFRNDRTYTADTYPGGLAKLNDRLSGPRGQRDVLEPAITALKEKYQLTAADLGK